MSAVFALEILFERVQSAVEATWMQGVTKRVIVDWGQTRPSCELNYGTVGRVVFVPGADDGALGAFTGAKQQLQPARALDNLALKFRVYCYGHNPAAQNSDDRSHDHVAMLVFHEVVRQIELASEYWAENYSTGWDRNMPGPVTIGEPRILKPQAQHLLGREILLPCMLQQPFLDMFDGSMLFTNVAPAIAHIADMQGEVTENSTTEESPQ
jgi:hypothetical protein